MPLTPDIAPSAPIRPAPAPTPGSRDADDLPPSAREAQARGKTGRWLRGLLGAAAAAALIVGGLKLVDFRGDESGAPNWQHVLEAGDSDARSQMPVKWIDRNGQATFTNAFALGVQDRDQATTLAVQTTLARGDLAQAEAIVAAAQNAAPQPAGVTTPVATPALEPRLTPEMQEQIRRGETEFYRLTLWDCCDEDGDIIDVIVNGKIFARVPLTRAGATVSIPVTRGQSTVIRVRAQYDGGGGVTVGCRSSRGDGFLRAMRIGEERVVSVFYVE